MKSPEDILAAALDAPTKDRDVVNDHLGTIATLKQKGYSWRDMQAFLAEQGVDIDHARLYRAWTRHQAAVINVPPAAEYAKALKTLKMNARQRAMLECHYRALNRTVTYTELAHAAGKTDYRVANVDYGTLGQELGRKIGFEFPMAASRAKPFYSGSLGVDAPRGPSNEYRLMMHHELAKAIAELGWFE